MDDYKLLPQFLIDALNKKRALNPTEASMAGKYADPKNQVGLGDIASSLDPVSAGVRGYNQLSGMNPQDFAKSALLMQSGTLPFLPKNMRNQYVNTALQGITGAADVFPAAVIGKAGATAGAKEIAKQIQTGTGLFGKAIIDPRMNIVPLDVAKNINMPVTLPSSQEFQSAVQGTKGATVTPEGLQLPISRYQKPEQELSESVRTGVFYLPEGSPQAKYYKGKGTMGGIYGGTQTISGETLYKNPLLAKGGTGGKAPEEAYKQLVGKEQFKSMQSDLMKVLQGRDKASESYMFLEKYAPDIADNAWNIVDNSKQGNQLRYALQEAVIANEARNAGHDAILGYSKGRGDKGNFFSEVFDLRESHYPSPSGEFYMNSEFEGLLGK
jgi:hypothetical protein